MLSAICLFSCSGKRGWGEHLRVRVGVKGSFQGVCEHDRGDRLEQEKRRVLATWQ